jgi:putative transposase
MVTAECDHGRESVVRTGRRSSNLGRKPDLIWSSPIRSRVDRGLLARDPDPCQDPYDHHRSSDQSTPSRRSQGTLTHAPFLYHDAPVDDSRAVVRFDLGGHTHYKLDYHFVWRTKFNRRILGPFLSPFLVREIETICVAKKLKHFGLAIAANHVHLCARLRPSQSPAQVMRWIKSTTSKRAFECYPELESHFGLSHLWGRGYHVESLGDKNVFAILAYIGRQDDKHDLRALEDSLADAEAFLTRIEGEGDSGVGDEVEE